MIGRGHAQLWPPFPIMYRYVIACTDSKGLLDSRAVQFRTASKSAGTPALGGQVSALVVGHPVVAIVGAVSPYSRRPTNPTFRVPAGGEASQFGLSSAVYAGLRTAVHEVLRQILCCPLRRTPLCGLWWRSCMRLKQSADRSGPPQSTWAGVVAAAHSASRSLDPIPTGAASLSPATLRRPPSKVGAVCAKVRSYGSVRGAASDGRPYRDSSEKALFLENPTNHNNGS